MSLVFNWRKASYDESDWLGRKHDFMKTSRQQNS